MALNEINSICWPEVFDSDKNWPAVTEVSEATGVEINRNRDAILQIERILGLDPHVGIYTTNPATATVDERLELIENGTAEGRFAWQKINVRDSLIVDENLLGKTTVTLGRKLTSASTAAVVTVQGPLRVVDSLTTSESRSAIFEVPLEVTKTQESALSTAVKITGTSTASDPLLTIKDFFNNPDAADRLALKIEGNVEITGKLTANFAISHSQLQDIETIPISGQAQNSVRHVTRGDYHSHVKGTYDEINERWIVDPDPSFETFGIIRHRDLDEINTKRGQKGFVPVEGEAYHVTGGDDHDHTAGRGAQIRHSTLAEVDPATSPHVTDGDLHDHSPGSGGAQISHNNLSDSGVVSHVEIDDAILNTIPDHLNANNPHQIVTFTATDGGDSDLTDGVSYQFSGGTITLDTSGTTTIDTGLSQVLTFTITPTNYSKVTGADLNAGQDSIVVTNSTSSPGSVRWTAVGLV